MEAIEENSQLPKSTDTLQPQPDHDNHLNNKNQKPIFILSIILGALIIGAVSYYLGTTKTTSDSNSQNNTKLSNQLTPSPASNPPTSDDVKWKTQTVQIEKNTDMRGKELISISFQIPEDWLVTQKNNSSIPNAMIEDCPSYVISKNNSQEDITITPICTSWASKNYDWPTDAVVIEEKESISKQVTDYGSTVYTVRYFDSQAKRHLYTEGQRGETDRIIDAIMFTYEKESGAFLPITISAYTDDLTTTDKIVKSLSANIIDNLAPSPTITALPTIPTLDTTDWETVSLEGVQFKIPSYAICNDDQQCSHVSYSSEISGHTIPQYIYIAVKDYQGGSLKQQYLSSQLGITDCNPIYQNALFGQVRALQIAIDGGKCQGNDGVILSVVGDKFVIVENGLNYDLETKEINRWPIRDTIISTLN